MMTMMVMVEMRMLAPTLYLSLWLFLYLFLFLFLFPELQPAKVNQSFIIIYCIIINYYCIIMTEWACVPRLRTADAMGECKL